MCFAIGLFPIFWLACVMGRLASVADTVTSRLCVYSSSWTGTQKDIWPEPRLFLAKTRIWHGPVEAGPGSVGVRTVVR